MQVLNSIDISPLIQVISLVEKYLPIAHTDLERAGLVQHFEIANELVWKAMKKVLAYRGIEVLSPRETFRTAALEKLINDVDIWFDFIRKRNLTVHVYHKEYAAEVINFIPIFLKEVNNFIEKIKIL